MTPVRSICVLGGSGFIGRALARCLAGRDIDVRVPTRRRERARYQLIVLPRAEVVEADIHADADLTRVLEGVDAVVNLVGILHERRHGDFQRVHVGLTRRVIAACRKLGIPRLVHMSSLPASPAAASSYLRSKGEAEALVRVAHGEGFATTVLRPSVVFGEGDSFLNLFALLLKWFPLMVLGTPGARLQPVWLDDVTRALAQSLDDPRTFGRTYELCGPTQYTLRELVEMVGRATGRERPIVGLSDGLSMLQARAIELSPLKLLTRDNVLTLRTGSVCACAYPDVFSGPPRALEAVLPEMFGHSGARDYDPLRARSGR